MDRLERKRGPEEQYTNKRYVKTILFSADSQSGFVRLNIVIKLFLWVFLSVAVLRVINEAVPDLAYALVVLGLSFAMLAEAGVLRHIINRYFSGFLVCIFVIMAWWLLFNPNAGSAMVGVTVAGHYLGVSLFSLEIAVTKGVGYVAMSLLTLLVLATTRDYDVINLMSYLKFPQKATFFVSLCIRGFHTLYSDMGYILAAQFNRGAALVGLSHPVKKVKNFFYLFIPMTAAMIRRAVETGSALEARGFGKAKRVAPYSIRLSLGASDYCVVLVTIALTLLPFCVNILLAIRGALP